MHKKSGYTVKLNLKKNHVTGQLPASLMNSQTVRNMCLFSGSRRFKLQDSSVLILVWLLGRISIVLARMLK